MSMQNALYFGQVTHHRLIPHTHLFTYPVGYFCLHLNTLETILKQLPLVGYERFNLISFYSKNYLPDFPGTLSQAVSNVIRANGHQHFHGDIYLLTHLAHFGYCYNPVSFYYCYEHGQLVYIVLEIHNTPWGERHQYVVDCRNNVQPFLFEKQNLRVIPYKVDYLSTTNPKLHFIDFLPSSSGLQKTEIALREQLGRLYYSFRW